MQTFCACYAEATSNVGVVVIFLRDARLFLKTVEWEDMR